MAVENIHFRRAWSTSQEIGRKITAANLADICAMGGWPEYLLVAVAFPKDYLDELEDLASGIAEEAAKVGASVIGGDLSQGSELVISITAVGRTLRAITRSGAKVGDVVMISHLPGWSKAGLEILSGDLTHGSESSQRALMQHRSPQIDYSKYRKVYAVLNSATDVSDGLLIDSGHIAGASGVALHLQSTLIEKAEGFAALQQLALEFGTGESSGIDFVLSGGEDHVLLVTTSTPEKCEGFIEIGRVEQGEGVLLDGKTVSGEAGYQHHW
jgi:thiamine-monophosphate kinase